ncbi:cyclase family protein [Marininema halotolerans]|uniref:Kynurenine formamidase n=1 Tax=Marininema halotolerans TaxID=1155944 RepID=A0A1I6UBF2_9BACL|nr:cyclase family protein [Marininema halotolerans]SFS98773.1 Kynurenine formamidase [Marininema halotolerans]
MRNGVQTTLIDLSDRLNNESSPYEWNSHDIKYFNHDQANTQAKSLFGDHYDVFPDGDGWATEEVTLSTHSGTHIDAPYHYGPLSAGQPAKTIDHVPLQWCYGDGVLLDFRHKEIGEGISDDDIEKELERIHYKIKPFDIVLIHTGASKEFGRPNYALKQPGLFRSAVEYLVTQGVKLIGIDAWGLDRPFDRMAEEAKNGKGQFWEAHLFGREVEYCQIERLCNLDQIPHPFGFTIQAFPILIAGASAGWSRVVAIIEEEG